jgi:glycerol-3-phosphate dehydrogenase (NAD(P)+)
LLAHSRKEAIILTQAREHVERVPGVPFPENLTVTDEPSVALVNADLVIFAVPSPTLSSNALWVRDHINRKAVLVSATKGLEERTGRRMSEVLQGVLPRTFRQRIGVLTGPNLSREIASGKPASAVVAAQDPEITRFVQECLMSPYFRIYTSPDVIGAELGGSLKNIIAIGTGICDGLGYGDNAKAAFITRGLAEITRLGVAAKADPLTFAGLAGLGDLIATCSSPYSRNRYVGEQLASGRTLKEILAGMREVAEGVYTTEAALVLAHRFRVEMPITDALARVLFHGLTVDQAIIELLGRAPRPAQNEFF